MSEITDDLKLQLAALTTLRDLIDERLQDVRAEVQDELFALNKSLGVKSVDVKLGDAPIASLTVTERKQAWHINEDELLSWVEQNYPDEIVVTKTIRESFKKHLTETAQLKDDCIVISGVTGEMIDGLIPKPVSNSMMLRFKPEGRLEIARAYMERRAVFTDLMFEHSVKELTATDSD